MMCSAAMSQPTTWMAINTKLELIKELRKADLISPAQYKFNLEKLAEEVGIETKMSLEKFSLELEGEFNKINNVSFEKHYS